MISAHDSSPSVITIDGLCVAKGDQTVCRVPNFEAARGERIGIVGRNGCGKTTLLRILGGLELDYAGRCHVEFEPRDSVFVHQLPFLFRGTVLHNVSYGLAARREPKRIRRTQALEWLDRLGIASLSDRHVDSLSGGERRRVAIARACVMRPKLLLLDEPLADLDETGIGRVAAALVDLKKTTCIITSPIALPSDLVERTMILENDSSTHGPLELPR